MDHLFTALFCTIHLVVGFMAGRRGRNSVADLPLVVTPNGLRPSVVQFEQAYLQAQPALTELPDHLQAALETLKQSVSTLAEQLAKAESPAAKEPRKPAPQEEKANGLVPSPLTDPGSCGKREEEEERRGHAVPEFIAIYEHDLSAVSKFERVICHDLSATGISFFMGRPLDEHDRLLITLGQQAGGVIMSARVMYSRPIIVRGEDRHRIGCAFERRLKPEEAKKLDRLLALAKELP